MVKNPVKAQEISLLLFQLFLLFCLCLCLFLDWLLILQVPQSSLKKKAEEIDLVVIDKFVYLPLLVLLILALFQLFMFFIIIMLHHVLYIIPELHLVVLVFKLIYLVVLHNFVIKLPDILSGL